MHNFMQDMMMMMMMMIWVKIYFYIEKMARNYCLNDTYTHNLLLSGNYFCEGYFML